MNLDRLIDYFGLTVEQYEMLSRQHLQILCYLMEFGSISPMEAFSDLGITKLSTRISEMKVLGVKFDQEYEYKQNRFGDNVHYMRYRKAAA